MRLISSKENCSLDILKNIIDMNFDCYFIFGGKCQIKGLKNLMLDGVHEIKENTESGRSFKEENVSDRYK